MQIDNFESGIEDKIVVRGKDYFSNGFVIEIWSENPKQFCAVVDGSIPYDVEIRLDEAGEIIYHDCDCPYDWGEYCKHEVAVLLSVREHLKQGKHMKKHGRKQGLKARLLQKSKDDLIHLLYDLISEYDLWHEIACYLNDYDDE